MAHSASRESDGRDKTHARKRFEAAIELYLRHCFRARTVVRVSEFAAFLHANRPYLSEIIIDAYGEPLSRILRARQLAHAQNLLTHTRQNMDLIAAKCGFGHRSTFFRVFRAAFGLSPAAYRRKTDQLRLYQRRL